MNWQVSGDWEYEYDGNGYTGRYRAVGGVAANGQYEIYTSEAMLSSYANKVKLDNYLKEADWEPTFYWTGNFEDDAVLINKPHIEKQGEKEDRTALTLELLYSLKDINLFKMSDALNIQNALLKQNNWGGINGGWRQNEAAVFKQGSGAKHAYPPPKEVFDLVSTIFPVFVMNKESLLKWYKKFGVIHPFTDLNGRVGGIIVSVLYYNYLKEQKK